MQKRPPIFRWPFLLSEELRRVLGVCLVLEGQGISLTYPIEHCIDRNADATVVQRGLIAGSTLEPTLEIGSWLSAAVTSRPLFIGAGIRTIHVHSASTSCTVLTISTVPRNAGFEPEHKVQFGTKPSNTATAFEAKLVTTRGGVVTELSPGRFP